MDLVQKPKTIPSSQKSYPKFLPLKILFLKTFFSPIYYMIYMTAAIDFVLFQFSVSFLSRLV